jgi:thioredoxin reductase (NADPH)
MCKHLRKLEGPRDGPVRPSAGGCEDCLAAGDAWVQLRLCMTCGHVGCCDSSPNRHATRHFHATRHPVIKAFEPGEDWAWCFVDEDLADAIATLPGESPPVHLVAPGGAR